MKRFICITIALCLIFGSICPVFGATQDVNISSYNPNGNFATLMASVIAQIANLNTNFQNWATLTGTGGSGIGATFQDLAITLAHIDNWFAPAGSNTMGGSLVELVANIGTVVAGYLPSIPTIASYISSWMTTNSSYLNALDIAMTNYFRDAQSVNVANRKLNTHTALVNSSIDYKLKIAGAAGQTSEETVSWLNGSPFGNIALILQRMNNNQMDMYSFRWTADLTHYNDQLSTWDSAGLHGSALTQVLFTPESAIQGLYRYLAFTQRDVARLTYTLANEQDQIMRQDAMDQQSAFYDNFIDPGGSGVDPASGRVSDSNIDDMGGLSSGFKENMDSGVGASHIWDIFDNSRYNWFTQATKNSLDTVPATRDVYSSSDYPTPLLDAYYSEMFNILGVNIDESR